MRRIVLPLAGSEVEFADREIGLKRFVEWAEEGTYPVYVVFGPEGCGKTALLRQAVEVLKDYDYSVALVSPLAQRPEDRLVLTEELRELGRDILAAAIGETAAKLIDVAVDLLYKAVKRGVRRRIALLLDDVFQAVGLDKAALLVKSSLNMIEYPSIRYERIVVVIATSEGITRREIGRHRWADFYPLWNMPRDGFRKLYDQLPGQKPPFEDVWRWTGGNPALLGELYRARWDVDKVVDAIMREKGIYALAASLSDGELTALREALDDPDALLRRDRLGLMDKLVQLNLLIDGIYPRREDTWLDAPPPEKDLELGIGKHVAWQTPLHREAVRRALEST